MAKRSLKEVKVVDPEVVEEETVKLNMAAPEIKKVITGSSLNFREGPSIKDEVISVLGTLTVLEVIDADVDGCGLHVTYSLVNWDTVSQMKRGPKPPG